jgi:hypothetical protein
METIYYSNPAGQRESTEISLTYDEIAEDKRVQRCLILRGGGCPAMNQNRRQDVAKVSVNAIPPPAMPI